MSVDQSYCLKIQCGCISQQEAGAQNLWDCTSQFGSGVYNSQAPQCAGLCPTAIPPALAPSLNPVTATQQPSIPGVPTLTPINIVQPLPDITASLELVAAAPQCSLWCDLNGLIDENPLTAALILVGAFLILHPKSKRRRG